MSTKNLRPNHAKFLREVHWTEERKIEYGKIMKEKWNDPYFRKKTNSHRNKKMQTKEYHDNLSNAQKERLKDPENKQEFLERMGNSKKEPDFGKKVSKGLKIAHKNPELCKKKSEIALELWKDENFVKKVRKNRDTKIEKIIQSQLIKNDLIFEQYKPIKLSKCTCIPDHINSNFKIAIFDDGLYWHSFPNTKEKDKRITKELRKMGWKVFRFKENLILNNSQKCVDMVKEYCLSLNVLAQSRQAQVVQSQPQASRLHLTAQNS